jgi:hypothetical protein
MLCSNVQEVVDGMADGKLLLNGPVPVNPIPIVEFDGVEYGGMVTVWDTKNELERLPVVNVELEVDESEVANPHFRT